MERTHSRAYPALGEILSGSEIHTGVLGRIDHVPEPQGNVPEPAPSIRHLVSEKTQLMHELKGQDDVRSRTVNQFILSKMREEGLQDTPQSFKTMLKKIVGESELTLQHDPNMIIESVYQAFRNQTMSARDYLLFLNTMVNTHARI